MICRLRETMIAAGVCVCVCVSVRECVSLCVCPLRVHMSKAKKGCGRDRCLLGGKFSPPTLLSRDEHFHYDLGFCDCACTVKYFWPHPFVFCTELKDICARV